jgi:hypothetical protein
MHVTAKKTRQTLLLLFLGFSSIDAGVSLFMGNDRSLRWSLVLLALVCAAWGINEAIIHLYTKYAPSRLKDSSVHLMRDELGSTDRR